MPGAMLCGEQDKFIGTTLMRFKFSAREGEIITRFKIFVIIANATKGIESVEGLCLGSLGRLPWN